MSEAQDRTSATLLARIRNLSNDRTAWNEFVSRYEPLIINWCRKWKLQEADTADITQTVLLRLAERLGTFQYDPAKSFRAYVKTLARYALLDALKVKNKPGINGSGGTSIIKALEHVEARDDLSEQLANEIDRELYEIAVENVRKRVEPATWEAFRLTGIDGLSGSVVAERLGLAVATVFKAKSRVQNMLKDEIQELQQTL